MKTFVLLLVCLINVQVHAGQGIRQSVRTALQDNTLIQKLATAHKVLPTAINSSNIGRYVHNAKFVDKLRTTLVAGSFLLLMPTGILAQASPDGSVTEKITERDKPVETVVEADESSVTEKVSERDQAEVAEVERTEHPVERFNQQRKGQGRAERRIARDDYDELIKSLRMGISGALVDSSSLFRERQVGIHFRSELLSTNSTQIKGQLAMMMSAREGENGSVLARGKIIIPLDRPRDEDLRPLAVGDFGHWSDNDQHVTDLTVSLGLRCEPNTRPPHSYLQFTLGGGALDVEKSYREHTWWNNWGTSSEARGAVVLGADLRWLLRHTLGEVLNLPPNSVLHYLPMLPDADLEYAVFIPPPGADRPRVAQVFRYDLKFTDILSLDGEIFNDYTAASHIRHDWGYYWIKLNLDFTGLF